MSDRIREGKASWRFRLWHKLALMIVLTGATIPYVTYLLVREKNLAVSLSQRELIGAKYLPPLRQLYELIPQHRGLAQVLLRGNPGVKGQLEQVEQKIAQSLHALEQFDRQEMADGETSGEWFGTTARVAALKRGWDELRERSPGLKTEENFDRHTRLVSDVRELIAAVGDASGLILDSDPGAFYLKDAVIRQLPQELEALAQLRDTLAGAAQSGELTADEQAQVNLQTAKVLDSLKNLRRSLASAFNSNLQLRNQQGRLAEASLREAEAFTARAQGWMRAGRTDLSAGQVMNEGSRASARGFELYDRSLGSLEALLQRRIDRFSRSRNRVLASVLAGVLLALALIALIARGIVRQVKALGRLAGQLAEGQTEARAEVCSRDELGALAQAFNQTLDNQRSLTQSNDERERIQRAIMRLLDEVSGVAQGDLTREAAVTGEVTGAIADSLNFMIAELRRIIGTVQDVTVQVTSAADLTQQTTENLVQGAQEQTERIVRTTQALERMSLSITQLSENATLTEAAVQHSQAISQQGTQAVQNTIRGLSRIREQVQETARRLKRLGESSQELSEVFRLIEDIADRTELLALNASIQATMAGESGQGFAVVAEEIERLAERSSEATTRIGNLVRIIQLGTSAAISGLEESAREVVEGSKLALQAGQSLNEIETVSTKLTDLIGLISRASTEQSSSSQSLARELTDLSQITQQTAAGIRESSVTVSSLAELARELRSSVASFRLPDRSNEPEESRPEQCQTLPGSD
ncbi:MAG TPA: HAMP domain-containing methyl-accepting chemotaxis protein [Blastocatellia bacterium]|nr:HAMP domain-containing methyl-accepting chemotaxis protein [Blastocatellia bacterium]